MGPSIHRNVAAALALASLSCGPAPIPLTPDALEGYWVGTFEILGQSVNLTLELRPSGSGGLSATLDVIERGVVDIPASTVDVGGDRLRVEFQTLGGAFEGELTPADRLRGDWLQAGGRFRLTLERTDAPPEPGRPQLPHPPFPYRAEDVVIPTETSGVTLAGTLTLPPAPDPAPGVVLVSGSGPQDRDEQIFGHRPFLVIADHLSRAGIAVLRYDDRGVAGSTGDFGTATIEDFATDALSAVRFLGAHPSVDATSVGILGHSEGGWVAPLVATRAPEDVSFVVLMAAVGMDGRSLLALQLERILEVSGVPAPILALNRRVQDRLLDAVEAVDASSDPAAELKREFREAWGGLPHRAAESLGISGRINRAIEEQAGAVSSPWLRSFLRFDPEQVLERVRVPVLALNGTRDLQVPSDPNLRLVVEALERGGNTHVTAVELEGLNHMFQRSETGLPSDYGILETTVEPEVLTLLADWIGDAARYTGGADR